MALRGGDIIAKKATTIAIVNQKGGTAKTTTCENLGIGLAMEGKKVLLVDVDPQGSLTISMGWQQPDELPTTLSTLMQKAMNDQPIQPGEGILHHAEGVDLIPANIELAGMEVALVNSMNREKMLKQVLDSAKREYDYILLDCTPSLGMLTVNALAAADTTLIPMQAQYLSAKGLEQLLQTIGKVRRQINPKLKIEGILLTMTDSRTTYGKQLDNLIRQCYGRKINVFEQTIPRSVRAAEISAAGKSIFAYGRYVFRYTTLRGEHRSVYAKELSELRKKEVKIRRAIEDGLDPDRAERITLNELFDEYISQKYDLKQSTMTNYKYMYNHYVRDGFGKLRISKIKYSDIKKFYYSLILEKGFKPNSMEIVHTLLHPTFTMAVRDGLLRLNPTEGVMAEIKKSHCWEKTKRHALTVAEQRAFTNYIANSEEYRGWFPLFTVMLGTGCRIGEVLGLRWQDVDFKNRTISINHNLVYRVQEDGTCTNHVNSPKTKAGIRIIPMIDEVFDAFLEEYQYQKVIGFCTDEIDGYSGFVFCTGDGKVYLPNAINRTIRSICADYNKEEESKAKEENRDPVLLPKFSCHILRHTFCTRFCENETNLKVIQEIMGHADISTTMDVYAEATQEKKKESMTSLQSALLVR